MKNTQNIIKKIIIVLIFITIILGVFFGLKFYQASKKIDTANQNNNQIQNRTPFQTKVGTSSIKTNNTVYNKTNTGTSTTATTENKLTQLWNEPVSGFDFVYKDIEINNSTSTDNSTTTNIKNIKNKKFLKNQEYIYFMDRKTGHIYENLASTTQINKILNNTLTGTIEAYFGDNSSVITRSLEDDNETITTRYIKLYKDTYISTSSTYLSDINNIKINSNYFAFIPSIKKIFYFVKNTGNGVVSSIDGSVKTIAIKTNISDWLIQYVNKDIIALVTKPSAYFKGYLFFLKPDGTQKNDYILGEKYGFNALVSPDGSKVLYNETINNFLETSIYDIKSKTYTYLTQATIVDDKCVWTNDSKKIYCAIPQKLEQLPYPDSWYKNDISFTDNIWSINPDTGEFLVTTPLQNKTEKPIDVYKIKISANGKYLLFQNKNDLSLWKYDMNY